MSVWVILGFIGDVLLAVLWVRWKKRSRKKAE
jgi:hypothetical protein